MVGVEAVGPCCLAEVAPDSILPPLQHASRGCVGGWHRQTRVAEFPPKLGTERFRWIAGQESHRHGGGVELLETRAGEDFRGADGGDGREGSEEHDPEPFIPGFGKPLGVELMKPAGDPEATEEEGRDSDPQGRGPSPSPYCQGKEEEHHRPEAASDETQGLQHHPTGLPAGTDGRDIEQGLGGAFEPWLALGWGDRAGGSEKRAQSRGFGRGVGEPEDLVAMEESFAIDGDARTLLPGQVLDGLRGGTVGMEIGRCPGDEAIDVEGPREPAGDDEFAERRQGPPEVEITSGVVEKG